jgi:hypothetical protein
MKFNAIVTVRISLEAQNLTQAINALNEMDYSFTSQTDGVRIVDTEITEHQATEVKE